MERPPSELRFEADLAAYVFGKTIDEWWAKPRKVRMFHIVQHRLHITTESYYNTPENKRKSFLYDDD